MCLNPYCSGQWSSTVDTREISQEAIRVLILVVVEDGLVPAYQHPYWMFQNVLILVVVEDGLVQQSHCKVPSNQAVLILVVVEDGLVLDYRRTIMASYTVS